MFVRVTCAGVLVGTAEFDLPQGVSHAVLHKAAGYACASAAASRLAERFAGTQCVSPRDGDVAGVIAGRWGGGRLALEDETGRELAVNNIVLLEGLPGDGATAVRVVADFRPDLARVAAGTRLRDIDGGNRTRPAA